MCAAMSIPIGVLVGIYLVEYGGCSPLGRLVSFMVDILAGVPSMVAALFIYAVWVSAMGLPRSEFAVSLALVLLMLPVIVRATEEMLRIVPVDLREASYALGVTKWKTITRVVLPTGRSGILTGILLALARVLGDGTVADPGGLLPRDEFRRIQRVHRDVARNDVFPDDGGGGRGSGLHRAVVGRWPDTDRIDWDDQRGSQSGGEDL